MAEDFVKQVSILDGTHMVAKAKARVKATTVANCFQKALSLDEEDPTMVDIKELDAPIPDGMTRKQFTAFFDNDDKEEGKIIAEDNHEAKVLQVGQKKCLHALTDVRIFAPSLGLDDSILHALKQIETECLSHKH